MTYDHQSQYQPGASFITRTSGCTWTTGANAVRAVTQGRSTPTPDTIHALLPRDEETSPTTPGWSLSDLARALGRFGVTFVEHTGEGWSAVVAAHDSDHYIALQGDSDQFGNATCSGAFDGDHCIGIHPKTKVDHGITYWWIDDPICPTGRWERVTVLKAYATKLWASVRFGYCLDRIPLRWAVHVPAGAKVVFFDVAGTVITNSHEQTTPGGIDRPCSEPERFTWPRHLARRLVRIGGGGPHDGDHIHAKWAKGEYA